MGEGGASGGWCFQGENETALCATVYPTFWRVFVGLLDLRVRLPHVLTCFRGIIGPSGPFTPRFDVFSWDYWTFGSVYPTFRQIFAGQFVITD